MTVVLSDADVAALADPDLLLDAAAAALVAIATGTAQVPDRIKLSLADTGNRMLAMPGHVPGVALATKIVTICPANVDRGKPALDGVVVLSDPADGAVLAVMAAGSFTGLRTAAASAVAARALARPTATVLAVIGAGVQARAHARALAPHFPLREVRLCGRDPRRAAAAASALTVDLGVDVRAVATPEAAVTGADLVVAATTTVEPVVHGAWLADGVHVCAVGAAKPTHRELDSAVWGRAAVVAVDDRDAVLTEAGDVIIPIAAGDLAAERVVVVGEILRDPAKGRRSDTDVTVFKGVGSAALDATVAHALWRAAVDKGMGTCVDLTGSRP